MKMLEVNNNIFNKLTKLNINSINIESNLFLFQEDYLIKKYLEDDEEYLREKETVVNYLMDLNIKGTVPVFVKVYSDTCFCGYLMPLIKNSIELKEINSLNLNKESLIRIMIPISETLSDMHQNNIIYGDISESNIILDDHLNPFFVDMDGTIINGYGHSNIPKLLFRNQFAPDDITPRQELDIFLLNVLFINILSKKNVSNLTKQELDKVIDELDISSELKKYFKEIPDLKKEYPTEYLKSEINELLLR